MTARDGMYGPSALGQAGPGTGRRIRLRGVGTGPESAMHFARKGFRRHALIRPSLFSTLFGSRSGLIHLVLFYQVETESRSGESEILAAPWVPGIWFVFWSCLDGLVLCDIPRDGLEMPRSILCASFYIASRQPWSSG